MCAKRRPNYDKKNRDRQCQDWQILASLGSWSRMGLVRDSDILGETVKEESKLVI